MSWGPVAAELRLISDIAERQILKFLVNYDVNFTAVKKRFQAKRLRNGFGRTSTLFVRFYDVDIKEYARL